ncbi:MAG: hypothetical protein HY699_14420 [Deltaproteobacteria bacterium]|nr:hypothetical protein [Deltaproteobacteria bacterium]
MPLSREEILDIEARNETRKALRAEVSKGSWAYDSFAWIEADTRPYKERSCILIRRRSWFDNLLRKHGSVFLDEGTTGGSRKHALQPARDGLYLETALNDPIEDDIAKLLSEVRQLRSDLPPPPGESKPRHRPRPKKPTSGRALPAGSRKGDKPIYDTEWEFREWFEDNLEQFGFEAVILSQDPCPDYVVKAKSGEVFRVEAELFAANFVSHGHDPAKVDRIVACFAAEDKIQGVPVLAANDLREYDPNPARARKVGGPLSPSERRVLSVVIASGGMELSSLAHQGFAGDLLMYRRVPPDTVAALRGKRVTDSLFEALRPETRLFARRFHYVLLGAGLSDTLCKALGRLQWRGLVALRPLAILAAMYDGAFVDHDGWLPTEVYATKKAYAEYSVDFRGGLGRKRASNSSVQRTRGKDARR